MRQKRTDRVSDMTHKNVITSFFLLFQYNS